VKLKSNFIELTPRGGEDAHLVWHYGVRIPDNRPSDLYTTQYSRFFMSFQTCCLQLQGDWIYFRWIL